MLREANLANKKFLLLPASGDAVLITAPVSVLDKKDGENKVARRLKEGEKADIDFTGLFSIMEKEDVMSFLQEKSKKMEEGMGNVIQEVHGLNEPAPSAPRPSLAQRASPSAPRPK